MRVLRECGGYRSSKSARLFEFEDEQGNRRMATESWLRKRGVDPDAEIRSSADSADVGCFNRDNGHKMRGRRKKVRPQCSTEVLPRSLPLLPLL